MMTSGLWLFKKYRGQPIGLWRIDPDLTAASRCLIEGR
jgi:hypothetical protein